MVKLLEYQEPREFYVSRYEVDAVRWNSHYDERRAVEVDISE